MARTILIGGEGQYEALVSDADYYFLRNWSWTFARSHPGTDYELVYARRGITVEGRRFDLFMHHAVLERKGLKRPRQGRWTCDHINGDTLDNRRENLRWAMPTVQYFNRPSLRHREDVQAALAKMEEEGQVIDRVQIEIMALPF